MDLTKIGAPVQLTEGAKKEIRRIMDAPDFDQEMALRIGVKGGGCSGLSYMLGFDKPEEDDEAFEIDGIRGVMKAAHGMYLAGMEIDFSNGLNARGFVFNNPNASSSCGCGTSFAV